MTPQPIHPQRFESGYEAVRRDLEDRVRQLVNAGMDETLAILQASGFTKSDVSTPEAPDDPLYADVMNDSEQADSLIRALMVEQQGTYVETLAGLQRTAEQGFESVDTLTLSTVLERNGTTLGRVRTLMAADDERVRTLSADPNPGRKVSEDGEHVLLPADVDPADLLTDPKAPVRAFRRIRELGLMDEHTPVGEGPAWETFLRDWKTETDKGHDVVATLERNLELNEQQREGYARVGDKERVEAKILRDRADTAAEQRRAAKALEAKATRLDTGR